MTVGTSNSNYTTAGEPPLTITRTSTYEAIQSIGFIKSVRLGKVNLEAWQIKVKD